MPDEKPPKIYGDVNKKNTEAPLIHAATVVLLKDSGGSLEVLMLQKNADISFGGMWVFPGGKLDDEDYPGGQAQEAELAQAARVAAVRETEEETGLKVSEKEFVNFSHWTPPPGAPKRFATWFFATATQTDEAVNIDGGEILQHRWITAAEALAHHAQGEIELAPPTWVTLYYLNKHKNSDEALHDFKQQPARIYETRIAVDENDAHVAMWHGDAGYEGWDAKQNGDRHRLILTKGDYRFENSFD